MQEFHRFRKILPSCRQVACNWGPLAQLYSVRLMTSPRKAIALLPHLMYSLKPTIYLWDCREKYPQHFHDNTTMSVVKTLWELLTKCVWPSPSSQITVTSCHDYPMTSSAPNTGCREADNNLPITSCKPLYRICILSFYHIPRSNEKTPLWCCWGTLKRHS
jgi:hypothetical protein